MVISTKNALARAYKKFQPGRHAEVYLQTLKEQDRTKNRNQNRIAPRYGKYMGL